MKTWQFIWRLWMYRPSLFVLNALSWAALYAGGIAFGLILQAFFNTLSGQAAAGFNLWTLLGLLVAIESARLLINLAREWLNVSIEFTTGALLRSNMFDYILHYPGARALPSSAGEAVSRFREDSGEIMGAVRWPLIVFGQLVFGVAALIIMARIHLLLTLIMFVPLMLVFIVAQLAGERIERYRRGSRTATGSVTGFLDEMLGAVQAVKVANAEPSVIARFHQLNEHRREQVVRDRVFDELLGAVWWNSATLGTGVLLLFVGNAMREGTFTVGDCVLFQNYFGGLVDIPSVIGSLIAIYRT